MKHHCSITKLINSEDYEKYDSGLKRLTEIYISEFPDENEREPLKNILNRVKGKRTEYDPHTFILLCKYDNEEKIIGGVIADYYLTSKCLHITYVFIDSAYRGIGAWSSLKKGIFDTIKWLELINNLTFNVIFFESNIPEKTDIELDSIDPVLRLKIFSRINARLVDIPYTQPALSSNLKEVHNLYLFCIPLVESIHNSIDYKIVMDFLSDLYKSLNILSPMKNRTFIKMKNEIEKSLVNGEIKLKEFPV
ncbi:MAG: hypothetical protein NTY07_11280 [Bacteroidia bacterium]|nr:hypothetical protein [Bacteroidia bacterium]